MDTQTPVDGHPPQPTPPQPALALAAEHGHEEEEIPKDLKRPHTLTVTAVGLLFLAVLAGLFFLGWRPHEAQRKQAAQDAEEANEAVPTVAVAAPKRAAAKHDVVVPCDVRPDQEALIFPRTSGYLKKLYVDIQDRVEAGQLLAEIDTPEVDAQLEQAKASREQAKASLTKAQTDLELAQRTLDRYENIAAASVTRQERDEKQTARDQAAASLVQAKANVVAADANVERLLVLQGFEKISAPFAGTITGRNYDVGALLNAGGGASGRELFRLTQTDTLKVYVNMPQVDASAVKLGQTAALTVRNFPGREFAGTVARRAGALDPATRTMPIELHFPNAGGELFAGMYGVVKLEVGQDSPTLLVPTSALVFGANGTEVAVVKDNKVHFQQIVVGRDLGTELEITRGVSADDRVVVNPGERLAEGVEVQAVDPHARQKPKLARADGR